MKAEINYTDKFSLGIVISNDEIIIALIFIIIDFKFREYDN